ncbi:hypothetical protein [Tenacibaculum finnmarkense]|uniref:hypothetical protein n=1 Tax=Tenacibaculum finnmarkense TaxID=2781243 RepID=UPI001E4791E5|nr:hypothetical protein [Tenacibaculum finnmarkense]MCD8448076.1 hypothetical protein [Tenacibaculum finnmarkense genomovar finnmarkense]
MKDIEILAELHLYSTENGGKENGIGTGYRPNHVVEYSLNSNNFPTTYIGQIDFDKDRIYPGETEIVKVRFFRHQKLEEILTKGRIWWIHEGPRKVGEAKVLEIIIT